MKSKAIILASIMLPLGTLLANNDVTDKNFKQPAVNQQQNMPRDIGLEINATYTPYSFAVTGKRGVQISWRQNKSLHIEGEYFVGGYGLKRYGLNLTDFTESLIVIHARHYVFGSFNLTYGIAQREYRVSFGSRIIDLIPESQRHQMEDITVRNLVIDLGLGNRWRMQSGITFGVDWVSTQIPFGKSNIRANVVELIQDEYTRDTIYKLIDGIKYVPTVTLLKLNLGYAF